RSDPAGADPARSDPGQPGKPDLREAVGPPPARRQRARRKNGRAMAAAVMDFRVTFTLGETLDKNRASPADLAFTCLLMTSFDRKDNTAVPPERLTVPRLRVPTKKLTGPAGIPPPGQGARTLSFRLTAMIWPRRFRTAVAVRIDRVAAGFTTC